MEEICYPKDKSYKLLQALPCGASFNKVKSHTRLLTNYLYDNQDINGLLIYHKIGSNQIWG